MLVEVSLKAGLRKSVRLCGPGAYTIQGLAGSENCSALGYIERPKVLTETIVGIASLHWKATC